MGTSLLETRSLLWIACLSAAVLGMALEPVLAWQTPGQGPKQGDAASHPGSSEDKERPNTLQEQARDEVELLEARREIHKAVVEEGEARLKLAKEYLDLTESAAKSAVVPQSSLIQARGQVEILQAQLKVRQAEQREAEIRLKHAKRRLDQLQVEKK